MSGGGASIKDDAWLASVMARPVFRVSTADASGDAVAAAVREHVAGARTGFYFAKVDASDVATTKALLQAGFFVADVNVTFGVAPSKLIGAPSPPNDHVDVGTLAPGDDTSKDEVLGVAHDSFRFTRFHLDPLVGAEIANLVKEEWVRNYAERKRGDHLFVARLGGKAVGFLAALKSGDGTQAIIDLVGVHPNAQRKGVGRTMIARFAQHYRDQKELLVGTQVANVASVQTYESMGFRLVSSQYVLHMHVRDGVVL